MNEKGDRIGGENTLCERLEGLLSEILAFCNIEASQVHEAAARRDKCSVSTYANDEEGEQESEKKRKQQTDAASLLKKC